MLLKKYISFLLIGMLVSIPLLCLGADEQKIEQPRPTTVSDAITRANKDLRDILNIQEEYFTIQSKTTPALNINPDLALGNWNGTKELNNVGSIFVYGSPSGYDTATGRNRYLGKTIMGDDYTNVFFRDDATFVGTLESQKWIESPWLKPVYKQKEMGIEKPLSKKFDSPEIGRKIKPNIIAGIKKVYPDRIGNDQTFNNMPWENIVHVLQPPTYFSWGMGRVWHSKADGTIWYMTIPIAPFEQIQPSGDDTGDTEDKDKIQDDQDTNSNEQSTVDVDANGNNSGVNLKVHVTSSQSEAYENSAVTVNARVTCTGTGQAFATKAIWYVNGVEVAHNDNFIIKTTRDSSLSVIVPHGGATVKFVANYKHDSPAKEVDPPGFTDNEASVYIKSIENPGPVAGGEIEVSIIKDDGINKISYHPQANMLKKFENDGYTYNEVFDMGGIDVGCFPRLNLYKAFNYDYYVNTLVSNSRKYTVQVKYKWKQTYHLEKKLVGFDELGQPIYIYVSVADPEPTANVSLNTTASGNITSGITYNSAYGEDADVVRTPKTVSQNENFSINAWAARTFNYKMPAFSSLNGYNDIAKIAANLKVVSVPSKVCGSCGRSVIYNIPQNTADAKTITVDATSAFPLNLHQSE